MTKSPKRKATKRTTVHAPLAAHSNAFAPHRPASEEVRRAAFANIPITTPSPPTGVRIFVGVLIAVAVALVVYHFAGGF
jgi:hypothetical protein